ncbi:MAG: trigger factor, partial [Candidatus Aminicenantes bacterium]|nr:trigger factor [Candidatus Aminicenantes bacterium]
MSEKEHPVKKAKEKKMDEADNKTATTKAVENKTSKDAKSKKKITEKQNDLMSKEFKIIIPRIEIEKRFDQAVENYSSEMKLDGFRKGKIPVEVVKSKYREIIIDEVVNKLIEEYTFKKIKEENIPIISSPAIKEFEFEDGKDLNALVSVDLFPEVKVPDLDKVQLSIKKDLLKSEDFNEADQIDMILENNKRKQIVRDQVIKDGDFVEFTIQSQFTDTKRMMPKQDSFFEVKEEPHFDIGELYKDLVGKSAGDKLEIERKYNKDNKKKNWADKTIRHFIIIKNVFEYVKPELNAEFLKSVGFSDEKGFKEKLKEEYSSQLSRQRDQIITSEIRDKLIEICDFSVPDSIVDQEVQRSQAQYAQIIMTLPEDKREEYVKTVRENAEKSIRFSFILEEVKKKFDIKVENEDLDKEFKSIADANNIDIKEVRKYYMKNDQKESLKDSIGRNQAIDLLKEKIKIK